MRRIISCIVLAAVWLCAMSALMVVVDALARGEPLDVGLKLLLFGGGTVGAGTTIALAEEAGSWLRGPAKDREVAVRTFRLPE